MALSKSAMGARVKYCNHAGWFVADIFVVGTANVVRANHSICGENIHRDEMESITHEMRDFPQAGFWRPDIGIFVVPQEQVKKVVRTP